MQLWIIRPVENLPEQNDPWFEKYDIALGFVVRAESEGQARILADRFAGSNDGTFHNGYRWVNPWLETDYSTCEPLSHEGEEGVIIMDYYRG